MYAYYPKQFSDLEVYYNLLGDEPEIEWEDIEIAGTPVSVDLHHHFISTFGDKWERDILSSRRAS